MPHKSVRNFQMTVQQPQSIQSKIITQTNLFSPLNRKIQQQTTNDDMEDDTYVIRNEEDYDRYYEALAEKHWIESMAPGEYIIYLNQLRREEEQARIEAAQAKKKIKDKGVKIKQNERSHIMITRSIRKKRESI